MLHRVFAGREFNGKFLGPARWWNEGESYTTLEESAEMRGARDIVKYDAAGGAREVVP